MRTLIFGLSNGALPPAEGDDHLDPRSLTRTTLEPQGGRESGRALAQPLQPEVTRARGGHRPGLETTAVVGNRQGHLLIFVAQPRLDVAGLGVAEGVAQRLPG